MKYNFEEVKDELEELLLKAAKEPILETRTRKLNMIKRAMNRIQTGMFGICESCPEEIEEKLLEHDLTVTRCTGCQRKFNREKARSGYVPVPNHIINSLA